MDKILLSLSPGVQNISSLVLVVQFGFGCPELTERKYIDGNETSEIYRVNKLCQNSEKSILRGGAVIQL